MSDEKSEDHCCSCRRAHWDDLGLHGIRRLVRAKGSCGKSTLWVFLLLISMSMLVFNVVGCVFKFLSYPMTTSYRSVDLSQAQDPSIILCNLNSMRLSVLYDEAWYTSLQELYSGTSGQTRRAGDMSSREVFTRAGHEIENMLIRCSHTSGLCDSNNFTMILTEHGLCHTVPKIGHGQLDLLLNVERYENAGLATDKVGVLFIFYDRNGHPLLSPYHVTAPTGIHTHVDIQTSRVARLPVSGACGNYSSSCLATCLRYTIHKRCGCIPFWAATGNKQKDGPICKMHSNLLCAEKEVKQSSRTEQHHCDCAPSCDKSIFTTNIYQSNLDSTNYKRFLSEAQEFVVSTAKMASENVRFRSQLDYDTGTAHDLSSLARAIDDLRYQIETLKRNIHQVRQNIDLTDEQLERRTWFHFQVGLNGLERTIRYGFMPQWDIARRQYLEPLIGDSQSLLLSFDYVVKKLDKSASSEPAMRRTLYITTEETLAARLELAIQGLENFTQVYYSFLKMEPSSTYILTPQRRYDAALLPTDSIADVDEALREEYSLIADHLARYMEHMLSMRNLLKDVYLSKTLNETEYNDVKTVFAQRSIDMQNRVKQFEDKIINKLQDGLQRQSDYFKKINATFFSTSAKLSSILLEATEHLDRISLYNYPHLVEFAQDAQLYLGNDGKLMSDLVATGLSNVVRDSVDSLLLNIEKFKAVDGALESLWQRYNDQSMQVWSSMLNNANLQPFYAKLNTDVQTMMQNPLEAPGLRELFSHNKLLGKTESEIAETDPDDFYYLLNADFPLTNEHGKEVELRDTIGHHKRLTDISLQLQDLDKTIDRSYRSLETILETFRKDALLSGAFVSDSLVSVSLRLASGGHDEVMEQHAYPLSNLLHDIGILFPVYLGASILSLFEVLDILCSCICCKHKKSKDEPVETQSPQSSPRHVTFHFPETGNHVSSPTRPALKRPRPELQGEYYPNDTRERKPTYTDTPVEML